MKSKNSWDLKRGELYPKLSLFGIMGNFMYMSHRIARYVCICMYIYIVYIPVVPHKAAAEVSKIGKI